LKQIPDSSPFDNIIPSSSGLLAEIASEWDSNVADRAGELESGIDMTFADVIRPLFSNLIDQYGHGQKVIDLGCGLGYLSQSISEHGYLVVGIDISRASIDYASQRFPRANFLNISITDHAIQHAGEYDIGIASMVFHNMPDLEANIGAAFRLLKKGGVLLISMPHPVFWFQTRQFASEYNYIYLKESTFKIPFRIRNGKMHRSLITYFHRPLSKYFLTLKEAGFSISALIEPENFNSNTVDLLFWVCIR
jgi:2-polyprenyl-3-methyl-5-hydroxy-6-metoxy-1,4-benzoquinol methylase